MIVPYIYSRFYVEFDLGEGQINTMWLTVGLFSFFKAIQSKSPLSCPSLATLEKDIVKVQK